MVNVQTPSDLAIRPEHAWLAARIVTRAEAMGLLHPPGVRRVDAGRVAAALDAVAGHGVARVPVAVAAGELTVELLAEVDAALEESPMPETEWPALTEMLGEDALSELVGVSPSSVRRYRVGSRHTPDDVAARLHFVALVVADLAGSYNARGIRRWFGRPRPQLDGSAPIELMGGGWDPADEPVRRVAALAAALTGAGNAT